LLCCNIYRKGNSKNDPKFFVYINDNDRFILSAKKEKGKTSFSISIDHDGDGNITNIMAKIVPNYFSTEFNLLDNGEQTGSKLSFNSKQNSRNLLGSLYFKMNLFGISRPRNFKLFLPKVENDTIKGILQEKVFI
jgi:hypothetical protein